MSLEDNPDLQSDSRDEENKQKCLHKAVDLLSRREHSVRELEDKLKRKHFSDRVISATISSLLEKGYLSDIRYAEMLIRTRQSQGYGRMYISQELKSKGVDDSVWHEVDEALDVPEVWEEALQVALSKKLRNGTLFISALPVNHQAKATGLNTGSIEESGFDDSDDADNPQLQRIKQQSIFKEKQKLQGFLSRRGFDHQQVMDACQSVHFVFSD